MALCRQPSIPDRPQLNRRYRLPTYMIPPILDLSSAKCGKSRNARPENPHAGILTAGVVRLARGQVTPAFFADARNGVLHRPSGTERGAKQDRPQRAPSGPRRDGLAVVIMSPGRQRPRSCFPVATSTRADGESASRRPGRFTGNEAALSL